MIFGNMLFEKQKTSSVEHSTDTDWLWSATPVSLICSLDVLEYSAMDYDWTDITENSIRKALGKTIGGRDIENNRLILYDSR